MVVSYIGNCCHTCFVHKFLLSYMLLLLLEVIQWKTSTSALQSKTVNGAVEEKVRMNSTSGSVNHFFV